MPYLTKYVDNPDVRNSLRFIDDNDLAYGKYMCNVQVPIFPLNHSSNVGCKFIYIASKAYREIMTEKIQESYPEVRIRYI